MQKCGIKNKNTNNYEQTIIISKFPYGGGASLEFPIYLVEGDNGQVGVDLYNYVVENAVFDEWGDGSYRLNSDEEVYFSAFGITEKISSFGIREGFVVYSMPQFDGSILLLHYTGNVMVNWS